MQWIIQLQVGSQHVGQAAHFAPAHGVGLARQRKRSHARLADAPRCQVAVDDAVDLVRAGRRLVHAHRERRDDLFRAGEQVEEGLHVRRVELAGAGHGGDAGVVRLGGGQGGFQPGGVRGDEGRVGLAGAGQMAQQAVEQAHIGAGAQRQVQIGQFAGGGAARVDRHDLHGWPGFLGAREPLEQDRVAPRGVRAHQHDEIGGLQVLVAAGHQVFAEGALVAGHGG
ncbi:hypothetical protein D3C72_1342060 [compost metagenome]